MASVVTDREQATKSFDANRYATQAVLALRFWQPTDWLDSADSAADTNSTGSLINARLVRDNPQMAKFVV